MSKPHTKKTLIAKINEVQTKKNYLHAQICKLTKQLYEEFGVVLKKTKAETKGEIKPISVRHIIDKNKLKKFAELNNLTQKEAVEEIRLFIIKETRKNLTKIKM